MKKLTVTIGIPAYNEEASIGYLLQSIIGQKQGIFTIKRIVIALDGGTDKTANEIGLIKDKRIKVLQNKKNMGRIFCRNQIIAQSNTDVLVFLDADGVLESSSTLEKLIEPIAKNSKIGLVGGNPYSVGSDNSLNRGLTLARETYNEARYAVRGGNNIFGCMGGILAIAKPVYKNLIIPNNISADDSFIYFTCINKGYSFKNVKEARAIHKFPKDVMAHIRRAKRHSKSTMELKQYFGDLVDREFYIPRNIFVKAAMRQFLKDPIHTVFIYSVNSFARYLARHEK